MNKTHSSLALVCLLFTLLNTIYLQAQTTSYYPTPKYPEFFKTLPLIDDDTPDWAVAMYDKNPNVYRVVEMYNAILNREIQKNGYVYEKRKC